MIATKFGFERGKPGLGMNSKPENIRNGTEAALKRLGTVKKLISEGKGGTTGNRSSKRVFPMVA